MRFRRKMIILSYVNLYIFLKPIETHH